MSAVNSRKFGVARNHILSNSSQSDQPPSPFDVLMRVSVNIHNCDFINTAAREVELAIFGCGNISNNTSARWNSGTRKVLRFGIKADQRVRLDARFAIPDSSIWGARNPVGIRAGSARRGPLFELLRRRIEVTEISAFVIGVVDRVVGRDCNAPWPRARIWNLVFRNCETLRINAGKLVGSEFAEERHSGVRHRDAIRNQCGGGTRFTSILPVVGSSLPTTFDSSVVNHRIPC